MESKQQRYKRVMRAADYGIRSVVTSVTALEFRREQYDFTQAEFASILKMQPSHYSEFINGKRRLSKRAIRRAIAIGVPIANALAV